MSKISKMYYALALDLHEGKKPVILPANDLYSLKADNVAIRLNPKNEKNFRHSEEYGRKRVIDGKKVVVRYIVFELHESAAELKLSYQQGLENGKRYCAPNRKSLSPTIEPLEKYTFPGDEKEKKSQERANQKQVKESCKVAKKSEAQKILDAFKKSAQNKNVTNPFDDATSSNIAAKELDNGSRGQSEELSKKNVTNPFDDAASSDITAKELDNGSCGRSEEVSKKNVTNPSDDATSSDITAKELDNGSRGQTEELSKNQETQKARDTEVDAESKEGKLSCPPKASDDDVLRDQLLRELEEAYGENIRLKKENEKLKDLSQMKTDVAVLKDDMVFVKSFLEEKLGKKEVIVRPKNQSRLQELKSNLLEEDDEDVPPDMFKVGADRYISKASVEKNMNKETFKTNRIQCLTDLFYINPANFTLGGIPKTTTKITEQELQSMLTLLTHMKWSYKPELDYEGLKDRVGKYTSKVRKDAEKKKEEEKKKREEEAAAAAALKTQDNSGHKRPASVSGTQKSPKKKKKLSESLVDSDSSDSDSVKSNGDVNTSIHLD